MLFFVDHRSAGEVFFFTLRLPRESWSDHHAYRVVKTLLYVKGVVYRKAPTSALVLQDRKSVV